MKIRFFIDFNQDIGEKFSTVSCLSYLNNRITMCFESGPYTGIILIDLQTSFDKINHEVLINKMKLLGSSKKIIIWFNLNQTFLEPGKPSCGVPQGSILDYFISTSMYSIYKFHPKGS